MYRYILLLALSLILPLGAQRRATTTPRQAQMKLQQSDKKDRPQDAIRSARDLIQLGEKKRSLPLLLQGYHTLWEKELLLDPESPRTAYKILDELSRKPWLNPADRVALALYTIDYYQEHDQSYYRRGEVVATQTDPIDPEKWEQAQYTAFYTRLIKQILAEGQVLSAPLHPYKALFPSSGGVTGEETLGTQLIQIFHDITTPERRELKRQVLKALTPIAEQGSSVYFRSLVEQEALCQLLLEQRKKIKPEEQARLLSAFVQKYRSYPELNNYTFWLYSFYPYRQLRQARFLETILREGTKLSEGSRRALRSWIEEQRSASIDEHVPQQLIASTEIPIRLSKPYLVTRANIRLYRAPKIRRPEEKEWKITAGMKPIETKVVTFDLDSLGRGEANQTITLHTPDVGNYRVIIDYELSPETSTKSLTHTHDLLRTNYVYLWLFEDNKECHQWLHALTGAPLSDTTFLVYRDETKGSTPTTVKSDATGRYPLLPGDRSYFLASAEDPLIAQEYAYLGEGRSRLLDLKALYTNEGYFITDRPAYRPGQTVHFYGVLSTLRPHAEEAKVAPHLPLRITIQDATHTTIKTLEVETDSYGRFTADLQLPTGGLTGTYTALLEVRTPRGSTEDSGSKLLIFSVFEYKRPEIELTLDAPKPPFTFGSTLPITGSVRTLSGSPVAGAHIRYQLQRVRHLWSLESKSADSDPSKSQLDSVVMTDTSGRFTLTIPLPQDPRVPLEREEKLFFPWYRYTLSVTATDVTGETHEAHLSIPLGHAVGELEVKLPQFIDKQSGKATLTFTSPSLKEGAEPQIVSYQIKQKGKTLLEGTTPIDSAVNLASALRSSPSGRYELSYSTRYRDSLSYEGETAFYLFDSSRDKRIADLRTPLLLSAGDGTYSSGKQPIVYWATSLPDAYVFYHAYSQSGPIASGMLRPSAGVIQSLPIDLSKLEVEPEEVTLRLYTVQSGRLLEETTTLRRVQPHKELQISWDCFRDRLRAGEEETWSFTLRHPDGKPADSTAVALWMYDAALDAFGSLALWEPALRLSDTRSRGLLGNYASDLSLSTRGLLPQSSWFQLWQQDKGQGRFLSPYLPKDKEGQDEEELALEDGLFYIESSLYGSVAGVNTMMVVTGSAPNPRLLSARAKKESFDFAEASDSSDETPPQVKLRQDFSENAFYLPRLTTDGKGRVSWTFRAPERLSRWRFILMAHNKSLDHLSTTRSIETYREFSIRPTLPRFLREGDSPLLVTEIRNETKQEQRGHFTIELFDPTTKAIRYTHEEAFTVAPHSASPVTVPLSGYEGLESVGIRLIARGEHSSDGEQHLLPVLSERERITETLAFTGHRAGEETISLASLFPSDGSRPEAGRFTLTLQGRASMLALTALPTLGYSKEASAFSAASALYAEGVARRLAEDPQLRSWAKEVLAGSDSVSTSSSYGKLLGRDSLLSQSPWATSLTNEREEEQKLARFLLASDRATTTDQLLKRLSDLQGTDDLWSWYPGMKGSLYTTEYVLRILLRLSATEGLEQALRLRLSSMIRRGIGALNAQAVKDLAEIQKSKWEKKVFIPHTNLDYLYLSALAKEQKLQGLSAEAERAERYFLTQLRSEAHRLPLDSKPRAAVALLLAGDKALAKDLAESLRQHLKEDETGLFFARLQSEAYSWLDRSLPALVETIELFSRLRPLDTEHIDGMKRWIIAQKRTTAWSSDLLSAEAIHALILGDSPQKASGKTLLRAELPLLGAPSLQLEGERIHLTLPLSPSIRPDTLLRVSQQEAGVYWGSATATYVLPTARIEARGKQLRLTREVFLLRKQGDQEQLLPLSEGHELRVGDRLRTRITLTLDRAIDFVKLSDPRPGYSEAVQQLPGYSWGGGTGYYVEPMDTATNFYFDHLNRGTYTLDYDQYVARAGQFTGTVTRVVSCYAPDFSAHTAVGSSVSVKTLR